MQRLFLSFAISIVINLSGCYKSPNPVKEADITGGERAFGAIPPADSRNYLLKQQALIKANLVDKGVTTERLENKLLVNIPGNVGFSINSADINWNLHQILDGISPVLKEFPHTQILVIGHSDSRGDAELNQLLSSQRAASIGRYLVRSKISQERISTRGAGQAEQMVSNDTTLKRSLNRRITLEITIPQR